MGGRGSGRWLRWGQKTTVEKCRVLPMTELVRGNYLGRSSQTPDGFQWINTTTGKTVSTVSFTVDAAEPDGAWFRLYYEIKESGERMDYKIRLTTTGLPWGGIRWWFT